MIVVVGGTYREWCAEPEWHQLYGSGGRAAAALSELSDRVELTTALHPVDRAELDISVAAFGFSTRVRDAAQTVGFHYAHGLARPEIVPPPHLIESVGRIDVTAEHVLRYGMLDADAVVHAKNAVYDPQDVARPQPFDANGSRAGRVAYVLNQTEGLLLTGKADPEAIARDVATTHGAAAVVVKLGARGALVLEGGVAAHLPARVTDRVWPIGSGDVFSAVFAHHWMERDRPAADAATAASVAAAYYCATRSLPIPATLNDAAYPPAPAAPDRAQRAYLAAPFFTMAQRWLVAQAESALGGLGLEVFSPHRDVGYGSAANVVHRDLDGLRAADVVFAILDGLDAGTLFEVGYARSLGKPTVAFAQNETRDNLKMLVGTDCTVEDDFVTATYRTLWTAMAK